MSDNVLIFGDSYSTFAGYIPDGYACYYTEQASSDTDVVCAEQTWWHQVITEANLHLVLNNSWSGSTICFTGYNNTDCSETSSFIFRLHKLIQDGFFSENRIDTVFVFGATNDSWANSPLGRVQYGNYEKSDLYSVLPAICYFLKTLKNTLPSAKIYCLINTGLKNEITECFHRACAVCGITTVTFDSIDKRSGHPTIKGMQDIKNAVLRKMIEQN